MGSSRGAFVVAAPVSSHRRLTSSAAGRGWHVLCEKPMAATNADCSEMIAACAAAGVKLAIGHYKRFFPASAALRELCGGGSALGELRRFAIAEGGRFTWPAVSPSFFEPSQTPGGVLLDLGVHVLDLLLWWLGEPTDFSYADDAMGGLEANARVTLRFGAATGSVRLSRDWATPRAVHLRVRARRRLLESKRRQWPHSSPGWDVGRSPGYLARCWGKAWIKTCGQLFRSPRARCGSH